ncbi:MAG: hypothetical protein WC876_02495 [Candidatus Thermoplasmatota archaeon]|jgi:hypothetical protein
MAADDAVNGADGRDTSVDSGGPRIFRPETVRAMIAYIVVAAAIGTFIVALVGFNDDGKANLVATFFSGLLGVVLGFYFGRQGVESALGQVARADEGRQVAETVSSQIDTFKTTVAEQAEVIRQLAPLRRWLKENPSLEGKFGDYMARKGSQ